MSDVIGWMHALCESGDMNPQSFPRLLVANVLRDHLKPPIGPRPGTAWARERARREANWGLCLPVAVQPAVVEAAEDDGNPGPGICEECGGVGFHYAACGSSEAESRSKYIEGKYANLIQH
jgi:hypothetical protein